MLSVVALLVRVFAIPRNVPRRVGSVSANRWAISPPARAGPIESKRRVHVGRPPLIAELLLPKLRFPPDRIAKFKVVEYRARRLLIDLSFDYKIGQHCRFLPKRNIVDFDTKFQVIKDDYEKLVEDLITNFDMYKFAQRSDFIEGAKSAYDRLKAIGGFDILEDEYVNNFIARIEELYPKKEEIRSKYSMSYAFWQMELPDLAEASIDDVTEEGQKIKLLQEAYQKKMLKQLDEYAEALVRDNREQAKAVLDNLIKKFKDGKKFTEASKDSVTDMITKFQKLNVTEDKAVEAALLNFKSVYLDQYTAKQIQLSKGIQNSMVVDLRQLITIVEDAEQIKALAEAYKSQIKKG